MVHESAMFSIGKRPSQRTVAAIGTDVRGAEVQGRNDVQRVLAREELRQVDAQRVLLQLRQPVVAIGLTFRPARIPDDGLVDEGRTHDPGQRSRRGCGLRAT